MLGYDVRGPVAFLTLDRAEKLNAMTRPFFGELVDRLDEAEAEEAVRVVIVHGAGPCFSVGGDIEGFAELAGPADRRAYVQEAMRALRAVEELSKPVIAAVHGHAYGGGCELTMFCDLVVADETARFGMPEAAIGLFPGPGVVRGPSHMRLHTLKYLIFTGAILDAEEARAAGLVNDVAPADQHLARAEELAGLVAERSPLALATAKALLNNEGWERAPHAVDAVALLQGSDDVAEGIAAFVENRKPAFRGR